MRGIPNSDYIDDGLTAAFTRERCLFQSVVSVKLLGSLGAYLGLPKSHLDPEQSRQWLGFQIDSVQQRFLLTEKRSEKIKKQMAELRNSDEVTPRQIASAVGRLVSSSPAILPALLKSRAFFEALKGAESWEAIFPNTESVRLMAQYWIDNLDQHNGRPWWPKPIRLRAQVDASGIGYGGILTSAPNRHVSFQGTFDPLVARASSALREVIGYVQSVKLAKELEPSLLQGSSLLILGDSQAAVACINKFRSPKEDINRSLEQLFDICVEAQCDVQARWQPREVIQAADDLSKETDAGDWGITPMEKERIVERFGASPDVDLFASDVHHVCEVFYSRSFTPGCAGIQALALDWIKELRGRTA